MRLQLVFAAALVAASFVMASLHVAKTQDKVERPLKVRDDLPVAANGMQILTGATIVGHGFNAKTGQQGLFPILDWTYQFNNTWMSPVTGVTYAVPDQINVASVPESSTRIVESMSFNFSTMFNEYTSWFKFGIGISEPGVFSLGVNYNRELARTKMEVNLEDRMQGFSQYWCTYYGLDMAPAYVLNPSDFFKLAISKLPATISTQADRTMYEEFVQSYGTHYVCYGAFGGSVHLDTYLDKSLTNTYTMEQIAHQLSLSFSFYLFNISGGGFHNKTDIKFATWFAQNAHTYMFWVGGAPAYQTNQSVGEWLQSIPDYAGLLNTTLCPMDVLINWDTARQATFKSFVHDYLQ